MACHRGAYKAREAVPDLWAAAAARGHGQRNAGNSSSGSGSFRDTRSIPLQLHLYIILKNLRLQKYIGTGTEKSFTSYFMERKVKRYYSFNLNCKLSR
jgi:hypothetical protein